MTVLLVRRPISVGAAYRALGDPRCGGVVVFAGRVRPDVGRRGRVARLRYEADLTMARAALERIERLARARFGARQVVLWHRFGPVPVGAVSVIVGVAAPHRREAFVASRYLIDALKRSAPIWKTELGRSGRRRRGRRARPPAR